MKYLFLGITAIVIALIPFSNVNAISSANISSGVAEYHDSDNDGQYDRANIIIGANFNRVDTPQDDEYIYARLQEVTNGVNDRQLDNLLVNQDRNQAFVNFTESGPYEVGNTYKFRICAQKAVVEEAEDSICTEDTEIQLEADPQEPEHAPDPSDVDENTQAIIAAIQDANMPYYHTMAIASAIVIFYAGYRLIIYPFFRKR